MPAVRITIKGLHGSGAEHIARRIMDDVLPDGTYTRGQVSVEYVKHYIVNGVVSSTNPNLPPDAIVEVVFDDPA